eukprot:COSAG05_NODE_759_length_7489_cov_110.169959_5_plen_60_part_00
MQITPSDSSGEEDVSIYMQHFKYVVESLLSTHTSSIALRALACSQHGARWLLDVDGSRG